VGPIQGKINVQCLATRKLSGRHMHFVTKEVNNVDTKFMIKHLIKGTGFYHFSYSCFLLLASVYLCHMMHPIFDCFIDGIPLHTKRKMCGDRDNDKNGYGGLLIYLLPSGLTLAYIFMNKGAVAMS
jgi:hypothetical protein